MEKANELAGSNPDYAIQDLYEAIANGNYVSILIQMYVCIYSMLIALPLEMFLRVKTLGDGACRY